MATTAIGIGIVGEGVIVLSALLDICTNKAIVYTCVDMIAILSLLIACEYCWQSFTTAMFLYVWVSRWGWLLCPFSLSAMNCKGEGGLKQYLTKLLQTTVFYLFFVFFNVYLVHVLVFWVFFVPVLNSVLFTRVFLEKFRVSTSVFSIRESDGSHSL